MPFSLIKKKAAIRGGLQPFVSEITVYLLILTK